MSWAELSWSEILLGRVVLSELSLGRVVLPQYGIHSIKKISNTQKERTFKPHSSLVKQNEVSNSAQGSNLISLCKCLFFPLRIKDFTVMTLSFRTDRSGQTVQTQIRLLLEEQSDQGLHCLLFHWHLLD